MISILKKKIEAKYAEVRKIMVEYEKISKKETTLHELRMQLKTKLQEKMKDVEREKALLKFERE